MEDAEFELRAELRGHLEDVGSSDPDLSTTRALEGFLRGRQHASFSPFSSGGILPALRCSMLW
jgi:hypothetical protein